MNLKVEMITTAEAAKQLGTTPAILSACIENKTIPVGGVAVGKQRRTLIVKKRWEAWLNAEDLILDKRRQEQEQPQTHKHRRTSHGIHKRRRYSLQNHMPKLRWKDKVSAVGNAHKRDKLFGA